jgi:ketosteroid isomerase-like protein
MSQQMLDAVQAYFDLFNAQDAQGIADLYADDATVRLLKKVKRLSSPFIPWR